MRHQLAHDDPLCIKEIITKFKLTHLFDHSSNKMVKIDKYESEFINYTENHRVFRVFDDTVFADWVVFLCQRFNGDETHGVFLSKPIQTEVDIEEMF